MFVCLKELRGHVMCVQAAGGHVVWLDSAVKNKVLFKSVCDLSQLQLFKVYGHVRTHTHAAPLSCTTYEQQTWATWTSHLFWISKKKKKTHSCFREQCCGWKKPAAALGVTADLLNSSRLRTNGKSRMQHFIISHRVLRIRVYDMTKSHN